MPTPVQDSWCVRINANTVSWLTSVTCRNIPIRSAVATAVGPQPSVISPTTSWCVTTQLCSIAAAISAELDDTKVSARQNRERNTEDQSPLRAEPKPEALAGEVTKRTALTGSWVWKYAGDGRVNGGASGVLVLNERANGALDGLSIVEHEIKPLPGGSTRMASAAPLLQAYVENQKIRFIINKEAGSTATEATLSADGRSLLGTSFLTLEGSEDQVAYRWTAEKIAK